MTETKLFRNTLVALGSTIVLPLVVGATGLAAPEGKTANQLVKDYVMVAQQQTDTTNDNKDQATDTTTKDDSSTTNASDSSTTSSGAVSKPQTFAGEKKAGTYTVKAGDTYGCIAEKYYGSYEQWPRLYSANAGWPGFEEYTLNVGATLQIPAVSASETLPKTSVCQ